MVIATKVYDIPPSVVGDNDWIAFGESLDMPLAWDTRDANANCGKIDLPTGGAIDVPVLAVGIGIIGQDLGLFNGITQPNVAVIDANRDSWVSIGFESNDVPHIKIGGSATYLSMLTPVHIVAAGVPLILQNTTDAASNEALRVSGGNRATPANNDEAYITFYLDDSTGAQVEYGRIICVATDVTAASQDARFVFTIMKGDTLTEIFRMDSTTAGAVTGTITAPMVFAETTAPAGTLCYIGRDNTGDLTLNALTGKTINLAVAGVDVVTVAGALVTIVQPLTIGANSAGKDVTFYGDTSGTYLLWDASADQLYIAISDKAAASLSAIHAVATLDGPTGWYYGLQSDITKSGTDGIDDCTAVTAYIEQTTGNFTLTGRFAPLQVLLSGSGIVGTITKTGVGAVYAAWIANRGTQTNTDAILCVHNQSAAAATAGILMDISGTVTYGIDMNSAAFNTADIRLRAGATILGDNTGDLTLNALSGKQINLAIAGADTVTLSATSLSAGTAGTGATDILFYGASTFNNATIVGRYIMWDASANEILLYGDIRTDKWRGLDTNTFIGIGVCSDNTLNILAIDNTAIGYQTLKAITTGTNNTAVGSGAARSNTAGYYNVAVGYLALRINTTGYENVALGPAVMYSHTTGYQNVAIGTNTLFKNSTGDQNVAIGRAALWTYLGSGAVAVGSMAAFAATGAGTVAIGYYALTAVTSGIGNIGLGYQAGDNITTGSGNIIIGYDVNAPSATTSYQIVIGDNTNQGQLLGDNAGDMTLNALSGKSVHLAVADVDVLDITGTDVIDYQNLIVGGTSLLGGSVVCNSTLSVAGAVVINGASSFNSTLGVAGTLTVNGAGSFNSTLGVTSGLTVNGAVAFNSTLGVASTLVVTGAVTFSSTLNGHTIPAVVADTFCLLNASQELDNKTLDASVAKGTWTASGTWTIPAVTLAGTITGGSQVINSLGHIGVGIASSTENGIYYTESFTNPDAHRRGILAITKVARTDAATVLVAAGVEGQAYILAANTQNWTSTVGLRGSDNEVMTLAGSTGTITGAACVFAQATVDGATVTNLYGFFYGNDIGGGTITTQYGVYIEALTRGATNYAIYTAGSTISYFGGHLGVGTLPTTAKGIYYAETVTNPVEHKFGIYSSLTAIRTGTATAYVPYAGLFITTIGATNDQNWTNGIVGVFSECAITAGATGTISAATNYTGQATIAAGTVTNRYGLYLGDATGAGAVTNQYGIYIESMTKGVTLNYAIYSAGGLVYLNSNVGIGTVTFNASAVLCLAIKNGTEPAAHTDDQVYLYSKDASTGGATLGIYAEAAIEAVDTFTASHKFKIWINGVEYWIQLDAV